MKLYNLKFVQKKLKSKGSKFDKKESSKVGIVFWGIKICDKVLKFKMKFRIFLNVCRDLRY